MKRYEGLFRVAVACVMTSGCVPVGSVPFTGGSPPPPPPPEPAQSAFDEPVPPSPGPGGAQASAQVEIRERHSESRSEQHLVGGRPMSNGGGGGGGGGAGSSRRDDDKPLPSGAELDGIVRTLKRMAMADRYVQLRNLIDEYYLTVAQAGTILKAIPIPDHRRALDVMACSVVDPQHAGDIADVVVRSDLDQAVSILTQSCFAKFPHDRRPPGKMARKSAPPPGAYRLPGED